MLVLPLASQSRRLFRSWLVGVLVVAGLWRALTAACLPAISRDGVTFCWYARELGTEGLDYLRTPQAQQHPLFPAAILAVQRAARLLGAPDSPMTWQRSGQLVCWLAGMAVVGLAGALTARLIRRLQLPVDERLTVILAMLLAALLDLNIWLSADVMSDQLHLAFYLAAVWLLLKLDTFPAALGCGLLGGLAFLTRQEGLVPVLAALVGLAAQRKLVPWRSLTPRAGAVLAGFLICAVPYWLAVSRFTTKKDPFDWFGAQASAAIAPSLSGAVAPASDFVLTAPTAGDGARTAATLAKLERLEVGWYALVPCALYKLFRAGRVVIPLLALLPLLNLRKRAFEPTLVGPACCIAGHFVLTLILLHREGYLHPRHTLVVVMLLVPLAAMLLGRLVHLALERGRRWHVPLILVVCLLPPAAYALRVPNADARHLVDAARWLVAHDRGIAAKRLLSGSSPRRVAFYADMRWEPWYEDQADYAALSSQIRTGGPGYFAIELRGDDQGADDFERVGNRELVGRLLADEQVAPHLERVHVQPGLKGIELHVFELRSPPG